MSRAGDVTRFPASRREETPPAAAADTPDPAITPPAPVRLRLGGEPTTEADRGPPLVETVPEDVAKGMVEEEEITEDGDDIKSKPRLVDDSGSASRVLLSLDPLPETLTSLTNGTNT